MLLSSSKTMRRLLIIALVLAAFLFSFLSSKGQVKSKSFAFVLKRMLSHKVPEISIAKAGATPGTYIFLDARELEEYTTSHLPNAIFVGYKQLDNNALKSIDKH